VKASRRVRGAGRGRGREGGRKGPDLGYFLVEGGRAFYIRGNNDKLDLAAADAAHDLREGEARKGGREGWRRAVRKLFCQGHGSCWQERGESHARRKEERRKRACVSERSRDEKRAVEKEGGKEGRREGGREGGKEGSTSLSPKTMRRTFFPLAASFSRALS